MTVQAIVDHDYVFRDICVGWAGSVHDARVFANSLIYKKIMEDNLLADVSFRNMLGKQIPVCLIGDSAYPLNTWLMKPFSDNLSLPSAKIIQLQAIMGSHCHRECIWAAEG